MKKQILLSIAILISFCASAQFKATITYRSTTKLQIDIQGASEVDMSNIPKEHSTNKVLYINDGKSMYLNVKEEPKPADTDGGDGPHIIIKTDAPDEKIYCDLNTKSRIEQREFMDRLFLITSDLSSQKWKLTGRQKRILNYPCQEAELIDSTRRISVWFSSSLQASTGPNGLGNLPGVILEANFNDGEVVVVATNIDTVNVDSSVFVVPTKGKKMTKAEYNAMVEEKMKEMDNENGGNNVIIKIKK